MLGLYTNDTYLIMFKGNKFDSNGEIAKYLLKILTDL